MAYSVFKDICIHKARGGFHETKDDIFTSKLKCMIIKVKDSRPNVNPDRAEE